MKKLLVLILFTPLFLIAHKENNAVDYAIISGKITNSNAKKIIIKSSFDMLFRKEITLSEDGSFKDTIQISNNNFFYLSNDDIIINLFLTKGKITNLEYDIHDYKNTLKFEGEHKIVNEYLFEKRKNQFTRDDHEKLFSKDEDAFKKAIYQLKDKKINLLNQFKNISTSFKEREKKDIEYFVLSSLNNYRGAHSYYIKNRDFKASENFLNELKNLDYENVEDYLFSREYRSLLDDFFYKKIIKLYKEYLKKEGKTSNVLISLIFGINELKNIVTSKEIRNHLIYQRAIAAPYSIKNPNDLEVFYNSFYKVCTNSEYKNNIAKIHKEEKLKKGKPSPVFTNYKSYNGGTKSLSDFKEKYVYIDVWSTTCSPCIHAMPAYNKLAKEYKDKNIVFVGISLDHNTKQYAAWKKMIAKKKLEGVQLLANNSFESEFIKQYNIIGIPRYLLIDPKGNIVSSSAPGPGDPELKKLLNKLEL